MDVGFSILFTTVITSAEQFAILPSALGAFSSLVRHTSKKSSYLVNQSCSLFIRSQVPCNKQSKPDSHLVCQWRKPCQWSIQQRQGDAMFDGWEADRFWFTVRGCAYVGCTWRLVVEDGREDARKEVLFKFSCVQP